VGTWGDGPFGSDTAMDLLEQVEQLSGPERHVVLERTLTAALEPHERGREEVLPEEVLAAASVVAANLPAGADLPWNDEMPGIAEWLPERPSRQLCDLAIEALGVALPLNGWWWESWVNPDDRNRMKNAFDQIISILRESEVG
jgi:hypothetical protein